MKTVADPRSPGSLAEILDKSVSRFSERPLFGVRRDGVWHWMTYGQFGLMVDRLRCGLAGLGIGAGDRVAVISGNRPEWAVCAYAAYGLGAVIVPMYETQPATEWEYVLGHSGAKILFAADRAVISSLGDAVARLPELRHLVSMENDWPLTYKTLLASGAKKSAAPTRPGPDDVANLIYTSGTTGRPKGVILTHGNIVSNVTAVNRLFPLVPEDRCLSFLPWAHAFGQTAELHTFISLGASIGICESVDRIVANLAEVKPTVLCAVPRIFNKIHAGVRQQIAEKPAPIRALFDSALRTAAARRAGADIGPCRRLAFFLADKLIFTKIRRKFGGRLRFAISGGAALAKEVAEFIDTLGIAVYEGYGLSETSPVISCNYPGNRKFGSVGKPLPDVRVEIDPAASDAAGEGEIVVRGPNVMRGYYRCPEENTEVFTADGGLRTGDLGTIDEEGFIFVTGRIKEKYKLENGKYVAPAPLEEQLKLSPLIANIMICGDNRPFNVALVVPDLAAAAKAAGKKTVSGPELEKLLMMEIEKNSAGFRKYELVRKIAVLSEDFTQANGLLTPTLKPKRNAIVKLYGDLIDGLYR